MSLLSALIFDVDGTLAETEEIGHRVAFNQAFVQAGLNWDWSVPLYGELLEQAGGKERIQLYLDQHQPTVVPPMPRADWVAALHADKSQYYQQLLQAGKIPLRPGVRRLIQEAREAGVRLAIATTSALANVLALLETTLGPDSPSWFEVIAAGDIVPAKKPAPDIYKYVLQEMALSPANCLAIEDSHQGLQAALQAGLKTIITINRYTQYQDFAGATLVLNHLGNFDQPVQVLQGAHSDMLYFDLATAYNLLKVCNN
jgi:HAD superfamily hydrolase (TIGR01509 family)